MMRVHGSEKMAGGLPSRALELQDSISMMCLALPTSAASGVVPKEQLEEAVAMMTWNVSAHTNKACHLHAQSRQARTKPESCEAQKVCVLAMVPLIQVVATTHHGIFLNREYSNDQGTRK